MAPAISFCPDTSSIPASAPLKRPRGADFNHDGKPDIVATDMDIDAVSIPLGDGKGGLRDAPGSPFPAGASPWSVAVDDVNKDGNLDLVVLPYERDVTDPKQVGVTVLLGDGRGGFATMRGSPFSLAGCRGPDRVATGDLNGDGFRDIVVSCAQNDKLMLYLGFEPWFVSRHPANRSNRLVRSRRRHSTATAKTTSWHRRTKPPAQPSRIPGISPYS